MQSYKFKLASEAGAVLIPGSDVTLSHVQATPSFRNYVLSYHASWYNFAVSQQRELDAEDIVLVSGCMKTSEWALAAVTGRGQSRTISFGPQGSDPSAQFGFEQSTDAVVSVTQRSGPKISDPKAGRGGVSKTPDQCLFMKYYRVKYRRFLREIDAASQPGYSGGLGASVNHIYVCALTGLLYQLELLRDLPNRSRRGAAYKQKPRKNCKRRRYLSAHIMPKLRH